MSTARGVLAFSLLLGLGLIGVASLLSIALAGGDVLPDRFAEDFGRHSVDRTITVIGFLGMAGTLLSGNAFWELAEARHRQRKWLKTEGIIIESWFGHFENHAVVQFDDHQGAARVARIRMGRISPPGTVVALRYHPTKHGRAAAQADLDEAWSAN